MRAHVLGAMLCAAASGCGASRGPVDASADGMPEMDVGTDLGMDAGADAGGPCDFVTSLPRFCGTDADCTVGLHQTSCCGDQVAVGVPVAQRSRFDTSEPLCRASYPGCGCPAGPTTTDSGETTTDASTIHVGCITRPGAMLCLTYVAMRPPYSM